MRWLAIFCLVGLGCGRAAPVEPSPGAGGAPRALSIALDLERQGKTGRAMAVYNQILRNFPDTREAGQASDRIERARRDAMDRARGRGRR